MEQQCKSDGLHLRNRDVVDEDRISELHEALLVNILSSLPTKSVIATSVLSKRWRHVWKMVQNLKFDSKYHRKFSEDVYRLFSFHKAPFLESLHLKLRDKRDALDVEILIGISFARHVRKLVLDLDYGLDNDEEGSVRFPSVLCSCDNNTLETLKLKHSAILLYFPSRVCLKSLKKLHLYHVDFRDEKSVCNLLCGCPSLEDLVVHRDSRYDGVWTFTIAVPSLQRLTLEDECHGAIEGGYLINAPALKYLHINMLNPIDFCLIEKMPELVEARIGDAFDVTTENILESLTSVKRLSLLISPLSFSLEINVPTGQIFDQLVYLELRTHEIIWWTLLPLMLDCSPNLQILKLITDLYLCGEEKNPDAQKWNPPECVPECLLFHLETFVWIGYEWQREYEKVATYILKNARQLKKATFSTKHIKPENLEKLEKRREMLDELASVVKASDSCHLVFESY